MTLNPKNSINQIDNLVTAYLIEKFQSKTPQMAASQQKIDDYVKSLKPAVAAFKANTDQEAIDIAALHKKISETETYLLTEKVISASVKESVKPVVNPKIVDLGRTIQRQMDSLLSKLDAMSSIPVKDVPVANLAKLSSAVTEQAAEVQSQVAGFLKTIGEMQDSATDADAEALFTLSDKLTQQSDMATIYQKRFANNMKGIDLSKIPTATVDLKTPGLNNSGTDCWANSALIVTLNNPALDPAFKKSKNDILSGIYNAFRADQDHGAAVAADVHSTEIRTLDDLGPGQQDAVEGLDDILTALHAESIIRQTITTVDVSGKTTSDKSTVLTPSIELSIDHQGKDWIFEKQMLSALHYQEEEQVKKGAQKQTFDLQFAEAPSTLYTSVNRLSYVTNTNGNGKPVEEPILHQDSLSIPLYYILPASETENGSGALYRCIGAIFHAGDAGGGHYTSMVRKGDGWNYVDDSRTSILSMQEGKARLGTADAFSWEKIADLPKDHDEKKVVYSS